MSYVDMVIDKTIYKKFSTDSKGTTISYEILKKDIPLQTTEQAIFSFTPKIDGSLGLTCAFSNKSQNKNYSVYVSVYNESIKVAEANDQIRYQGVEYLNLNVQLSKFKKYTVKVHGEISTNLYLQEAKLHGSIIDEQDKYMQVEVLK